MNIMKWLEKKQFKNIPNFLITWPHCTIFFAWIKFRGWKYFLKIQLGESIDFADDFFFEFRADLFSRIHEIVIFHVD